MWGPLGEVSLSLFIMELEWWALNLHFLISPILTSSFELHDLHVRAFTESLLFGCLHSTFGHPEVLHEQFGI